MLGHKGHKTVSFCTGTKFFAYTEHKRATRMGARRPPLPAPDACLPGTRAGVSSGVCVRALEQGCARLALCAVRERTRRAA